MIDYNRLFPHYVEDWILWLSCRVDRLGNTIDFPFYATPPVRVANYDVKFLDNVGDSISQKIGLTKSQAELAVTIITKHKKQIKKLLNRDVDYLLDNPEYKLSIRTVNQSYEVLFGKNNHYFVKFPYDPKMVDVMHRLSGSGGGDYQWNNSEKIWYIARTEKNLRQLYKFLIQFQKCPWQIDARVQEHLDVVHSVLKNQFDYLPHVDLIDDKFIVKNSNKFIDAAIKDFDLTQPIPNICLRLEKFGLSMGNNLTNYVQKNYSSIANALLASQADILEKGKRFESPIDYKNLKDLMESVDARFWVFATYGMSVTDSLYKSMDVAYTTHTSGEKIFLNHTNRGNRSEPILEDLDLADSIIITDNTMVLGKYYTKKIIKTPVMKMFYLFGKE